MEKARSDKIRRILIGTPLPRLLAQIRARAEQSGLAAVRSVVFRDLTDAERDALAGLLGRATLRRGHVTVSFTALDQAVRVSRLQASLEEVLVALGGPLRNRRAERVLRRSTQDAAYARALLHPTVQARPVLEAWLFELRTTGLAARAARKFDGDEEALLQTALNVVERLPAAGLLLPVLAAQTTGDTHALDAGRTFGAVILKAAQRLARWPSAPVSAEERRRLWSLVGVECDALSPTVLVLGLAPEGADLLSRRLALADEAGEPARIMLAELERYGLGRVPHGDCLVVENPAVVAAAAEESRRSARPIICVEGMPNTAAWRLLAALREQGVVIWFHVDFDWGGVRIGNLLVERIGAVPCRMSAADYVSAAAALDDTVTLSGEPTQAKWDGALHEEMVRGGVAVYEELVIELLVAAIC